MADYSGDEDDAGSSATFLQAVGQMPTQTTVTSSSAAPTYGQNVTLTATVTPTPDAAASPTGTVTFYDYETTAIATVGVSTAAGATTATLDTSGLMGGPHAITASYNGDPSFGPSSPSAPVMLDVAEAPTTVTLATSSDASVVGQPVVFTVTIGSAAAGETGTVQFADDGVTIGSGAVSGGQATFETDALTLGAHPMTAVYEGDDDFVGNSSTNTVVQTVDPASTSVDVTGDHDPGVVGQAIAYTASVAVATPGSGTPTGSVSFGDAGSPIPTCQDLALPPTPPLEVTCSVSYGSDGRTPRHGHLRRRRRLHILDRNPGRGRGAGVHHHYRRSVPTHLDVGAERHTHRDRGPDDRDGDAGRNRHVQRRRDCARHLDVVDHRRGHVGQHARHDAARGLRLGHGLPTAVARASSRARRPAPRRSR